MASRANTTAVATGPIQRPPGSPGPDPLADVLRTVALEGALFFLVDATAPWCVDVPETAKYAEILAPRGRRIVSFHIALSGGGLARVDGGEAVPFFAGDVIVFSQGDGYIMESEPGAPPDIDRIAVPEFLRKMAEGRLPFVIAEGGGGEPRGQFACGFLSCDARPFNPLLDALPPLLRIPAAEADDLLRRLIELALAEAQTRRQGGASIRLRLAELLFVEVIRRHLERAAPEETGWIAGLRDPGVGRALGLLHATPEAPWTLDRLAREAGVSRSALAERFRALIGQSPMQYLAAWRIQRAARLLRDGPLPVAEIGRRVGYASEAAFSRSFKKLAGASPREWRRG